MLETHIVKGKESIDQRTWDNRIIECGENAL
jgi:hypothetical protein